MQQKLKILLVGPPQSGKTSLANLLSDTGDVVTSAYRATKGCRIVEFEVPHVDEGLSNTKVEVEMWDVSGDKGYASCWPAIERGAHGVMFVYDAAATETRLLESFHTRFAAQRGLRDAQCLVIRHDMTGEEGQSSSNKLSSVFSGIVQTEVDLSDQEGASRLRRDFNHFVSRLLVHLADAAERSEVAVLQ